MFKSLIRSISAHERLQAKAYIKKQQSKTSNEIVKYATKADYHKDAAMYQKKLNRRLSKIEKKQLFRAYDNYHSSKWGLPTKKYKNQPNYINFQ